MGAAIYNAGHWYGFKTIQVALGLMAHGVSAPIGLIWIAHIAFDRVLAFGLKYPDRFKANLSAAPGG